jgi:serine palmitoyltransferase
MSPLAAQQVLSAFQLLQGTDGSTRGSDKVAQLKANSNYFRWHLLQLGFHVLGDWDSPIMPIMLYLPGALRDFSQLCLRHHVAVVVVGFPATSLLTARTRVCISAAHSRGDLDYCLSVFERVGKATGCLYRRASTKQLPPLADVVRGAGEYADLSCKAAA